MANSFTSNVTRKLAREFTKAFESERVMSKGVNTQFLKNVPFNPSSGTTVDIKRPTDYVSTRTSDGDISGSAPNNDIITGKATATVQDYFTVDLEWTRVEEALEMDQLPELLAPAARRIVTDMELDFAAYMMKNCNLSYGTPGNSVNTWAEVANFSALMKSVGVPDGDWCCAVNPFTQVALAGVQNSLNAGDSLVSTAFRKATLAENFAGMRVMTATTLPTYSLGSFADLAGAINGTPTATYVAAKDTMTQSIPVDGFTASAVIPAGAVVEVTGRNRLNLSTREKVKDASGADVKWRGVVTASVTLSSGAGTIVVAGPAIYESGGQYNTVDSALADNDVITVLGADGGSYQPNLFWHKDAFCIGSVPIPKLYATDTLVTTADGLQMRVSKFSDGLSNKQICRFDFQPAYGTFNPFFAGHGYGTS